MSERKLLCLVDGSSYVFRAYHAVRGLSNSKGMSTNALFGYLNMLIKLLDELKPVYAAVVLDSIGPTFRKEMYPAYKAHRPPVPEELKEQLPYIEPLTLAMGVPCIRAEGFEADDVIATLAKRGEEQCLEVLILSSDKDLMQLIGPNVTLYDTMKDRRIGAAEVIEKFGVGPDGLGDLLAIMGDASDNVPGVHGIGPKGAAKLLAQFGSLEAILDSVDKVKSPREQQALRMSRDDALLSRKLVALRFDAPVAARPEQLVPMDKDVPKLRELFGLFEFRTHLKKLLPGSQPPTSPAQAGSGLTPPSPALRSAQGELGGEGTETVGPQRKVPGALGLPFRAPEKRKEEGPGLLVPPYPALPHEGGGDVSAAALTWVDTTLRMPLPVVVTEPKQLVELVHAMAAAGRAAVDTETTSVNPAGAELVGISVCVDPSKVFYIPVGHAGDGAGKQLSLGYVRDALSPLLADPAIGKIGQHFKYDTVVLWNHGFPVAGLAFDTMLASYLLDPGRGSHGLDALAMDILGIRTISYKEVTSRSGVQVRFDLVPIADAARYSGEDAWATLLLEEKLRQRIEAKGMLSLLVDVELPLSDVLARMEQTGVAIDSAALDELSKDFGSRIARLEQEIVELAGTSFNVNSPKQLAEILFERLHLPVVKKTKTGPSTDQDVLEELLSEHPLPEKVLAYRTLAKLRSTYVDVLPTLVLPRTGRIHTSFNQAVTATGRLSSSDPNLQNIPVRGEEGIKIRKAFIPAPGRKFLSADYSQVELRILAHLSGDPGLTQAFQRGEDIHSRTASEIFQVLPGMVTPDMRRVAKTINFGVIYGMSPNRLAREQKIPLAQARAFVDAYFARYRKIKEFLDACVQEGSEKGYVETILKRRRYLPELQSKNNQVRSSGERMAINTPVQGGAADVVKIAMIRLDKEIRDRGLDAAMVLQVHDELVLEVAPEQAEEVSALVRETMEGAFKLSVPLKVDIEVGDNWAEVHG